MRTLRFLRRFQNHQEGDVAEYGNNVAHALIENGIAALVTLDEKGKLVETTDLKKLSSRKDISEPKKRDRRMIFQAAKDKMIRPGKEEQNPIELKEL